MIELEDQYRFRFDYGAPGDQGVEVPCARCWWSTTIEDDEALADLLERIQAHTEVCP